MKVTHTYLLTNMHTYILLQAGRYRQAIDEGYKRALELEPNNAQYQQGMKVKRRACISIQAYARACVCVYIYIYIYIYI